MLGSAAVATGGVLGNTLRMVTVAEQGRCGEIGRRSRWLVRSPGWFRHRAPRGPYRGQTVRHFGHIARASGQYLDRPRQLVPGYGYGHGDGDGRMQESSTSAA